MERSSVTAQRTYWHLQTRGRVPSSYEVETTRLLYHSGRGFEVPTPGGAWYERHQTGSRLKATFARFSDPRQTTYASYVRIQHEQEAFVDELLRSAVQGDYDGGLDGEWRNVLGRLLPVLRFPCHGLHMLAAYLGHMAPEGRVVVAFAFAAGDELRRIQRLAYRSRQLQDLDADLGARARAEWQAHPAWQPLRELIERLLVTYDFGESLVAASLVLAPAFDALFMHELAKIATMRGDRLLAQLWFSLEHDCRWHRAFTRELITVARTEDEQNGAVIEEWARSWWPRVHGALAAALERFGLSEAERCHHLAEVVRECQGWWNTFGVSIAPEGGVDTAGRGAG
jgi:toluene monooxygenase system protein E